MFFNAMKQEINNSPAPQLFIGGEKDVIMPAALNRKSLSRYHHHPSHRRRCAPSQGARTLSASQLLALAPVVLLLGCGKPSPQNVTPAPTVSVFLPVEREVVEWDEFIGHLESPETVEIKARVSGYLDSVHFKEGKEIKKGDLLFTIDRRPYQAEFDRAQAELERAQSQADLARNDADRARRLIATKAISEEEFDTKTKTYSATLAAVKSAKAALGAAALNLEFTEIRSPIDGRVSRALVTEGNLVSGG